MPRPPDESTRRLIVELRANDRLTHRLIAVRAGVAPRTVYKYLEAAGLKQSRRGRPSRR